MIKLILFTLTSFGLLLSALAPSATDPVSAKKELWQQVEVIRTAYGVPHIRAENLRSAGYALAWLQLEDYGDRTAMSILSASGRAASVHGYERIDGDFAAMRQREKARGKYDQLSREVRDVYEGFAAGVNRFIELHPKEFPAGMPRDFTGFDVLSTELGQPNARKVRTFVQTITGTQQPGRSEDAWTNDDEGTGLDDGSNTWALAPSRTKSGKAILMRNPHLNWSAGYYEAHMTVPGVIDFYGDFRIGGPFAVIGGFNRDLGFSTTNNSQDLDQIYALDADPKAADHYLFDGKSVPLIRELVSVPFRNGEGVSTETREFWSTPLGPVIHRGNGKIFVFKYAGDGEVRGGDQFLKMMRARTLDEWKTAMRMRARTTSNFTYADRAGNIFYIWNASLPLLPHAPTDEVTAVAAKGEKDVWMEYVPFDQLPQVLNPPGGYVQNQNSSHHYTNIRTPVKTENRYPNFEGPRLSLRTQLALQLLNGDEKFSLEDVVKLKHTYRALLADRVKPALISAVKATKPEDDVAAAIELLEKWDNTASHESRGSVIFQLWWRHYSGLDPVPGGRSDPFPEKERYQQIWSVTDPFNTPSGLSDHKRASESFAWAVEETKKRYGTFDVTWGEVHRVRRGDVDVPVGGCGNDLGCFRILTFRDQPDGKRAAVGGDGWVFAVEFGDVPRAYSVLAYGQSSRPDSPYHSDQAAMFAKGEMKTVAFTAADIDKQALKRYRPGERPAR